MVQAALYIPLVWLMDRLPHPEIDAPSAANDTVPPPSLGDRVAVTVTGWPY